MKEVKLENVSKKDIADYVTGMTIKKAGFGGLDRVDVYVHIQQIVKMYDVYAKEHAEAEKKAVEKGLDKKLEEEKARLEKQYKQELKTVSTSSSELEEKDQEIANLRGEIENLSVVKTQFAELKSAMGQQFGGLEAQKQELLEEKHKLERVQREFELDKQELEYARTRAGGLEEELLRSKQYIISLEEKVKSDKGNSEVLSVYKDKIHQLQSELFELKSAAMDANKEQKFDSEVSQELMMGYLDKIEELNGALRARDDLVAETNRKLQSVEERAREKERQYEAIEATTRAVAEKPVDPYSDEIADILREARREGQSIIDKAQRKGQMIIDNARNEADREVIKVLNVRAKYKIENEMYDSWCKEVENEKVAVDKFLTQMANQYKNVSRALLSAKEDVDSFDIGRVNRVKNLPKLQMNHDDPESTKF
ncbi:MAG: hypothetical protein FWE25_05365 [Lachnospiraceae bacterium]|nr:hypothetical protein [Lachnospiraceae bacterium]